MAVEVGGHFASKHPRNTGQVHEGVQVLARAVLCSVFLWSGFMRATVELVELSRPH